MSEQRRNAKPERITAVAALPIWYLIEEPPFV
jgi:hypothetical protein